MAHLHIVNMIHTNIWVNIRHPAFHLYTFVKSTDWIQQWKSHVIRFACQHLHNSDTSANLCCSHLLIHAIHHIFWFILFTPSDTIAFVVSGTALRRCVSTHGCVKIWRLRMLTSAGRWLASSRRTLWHAADMEMVGMGWTWLLQQHSTISHGTSEVRGIRRNFHYRSSQMDIMRCSKCWNVSRYNVVYVKDTRCRYFAITKDTHRSQNLTLRISKGVSRMPNLVAKPFSSQKQLDSRNIKMVMKLLCRLVMFGYYFSYYSDKYEKKIERNGWAHRSFHIKFK